MKLKSQHTYFFPNESTLNAKKNYFLVICYQTKAMLVTLKIELMCPWLPSDITEVKLNNCQYLCPFSYNCDIMKWSLVGNGFQIVLLTVRSDLFHRSLSLARRFYTTMISTWKKKWVFYCSLSTFYLIFQHKHSLKNRFRIMFSLTSAGVLGLTFSMTVLKAFLIQGCEAL